MIQKRNPEPELVPESSDNWFNDDSGNDPSYSSRLYVCQTFVVTLLLCDCVSFFLVKKKFV